MPIFKIVSDGSAVDEFHEHDRSEEELRTLFERHGLRFVEKNLRFVGSVRFMAVRVGCSGIGGCLFRASCIVDANTNS
jgi:hypothetical protein